MNLKQTQSFFVHLCLLCFASLLLFSCTSPDMANHQEKSTKSENPTRQGQPSPTPVITPTATWGSAYTDARLGFQLRIPSGWKVTPQPGSRNTHDITALQMRETGKTQYNLISISVIRDQTMPNAFGQRGTPNQQIGSYPAFYKERAWRAGRVHCLSVFFLARTDFVTADWCSAVKHPSQDKAIFERILATYQPAPENFVTRSIQAPAPQTCQQLQQGRGHTAENLTWGWQLAAPNAAGWQQLNPGAYLCSNTSSPDPFLFQCTELANRVLNEWWALPRLSQSAGRYYDFYQDGKLNPGAIRDFPVGTYQLSDDASQGKSSFRPVAGDLLIFQDVNNTQVGWKSGHTSSPGHVVVITGVDDSYVYIAQENYSDDAFFQALPITRTANGYHITEYSGNPSRVTRGWIHFTANEGPRPREQF